MTSLMNRMEYSKKGESFLRQQYSIEQNSSQMKNTWNNHGATTDSDSDNSKQSERLRRAAGYIFCCPNCKAFLIGLLIASLLAGIALAVVITLWLKPISDPNTTASNGSSSIPSTTNTSMPSCTPTNIGSSSTLLSISSLNVIGYLCYSYEWIAPNTGAVTLAFQIRNDPYISYVDDVSVYNGSTQMLVNGGFETGSLSPWVVTNSSGSCGYGSVLGEVCNSDPHSGNYSYCDGCSVVADKVSQSFMAVTGQVYVVSFWLAMGAVGANGSVVSALVTLQ